MITKLQNVISFTKQRTESQNKMPLLSNIYFRCKLLYSRQLCYLAFLIKLIFVVIIFLFSKSGQKSSFAWIRYPIMSEIEIAHDIKLATSDHRQKWCKMDYKVLSSAKPDQLDDVTRQKLLDQVEPGGFWEPKNCKAKYKVWCWFTRLTHSHGGNNHLFIHVSNLEYCRGCGSGPVDHWRLLSRYLLSLLKCILQYILFSISVDNYCSLQR